MPDICMCMDHACPLNKSCYRHNAHPSQYQSYFADKVWDEEKQKCDHYWEEPYKVDANARKILAKMTQDNQKMGLYDDTKTKA